MSIQWAGNRILLGTQPRAVLSSWRCLTGSSWQSAQECHLGERLNKLLLDPITSFRSCSLLCWCPCRGINIRGDAGVCKCVVALSFCFQRLPRHCFGTGRCRTGLTETSTLGELWLQGWWASICQLSPWRHPDCCGSSENKRCLPTCWTT